MSLTDAELTRMRTDIESLLPDTGYILSKTSTPDGEGGQDVTWGTAGTVSCRVDHRRGMRESAGGAIVSFNERLASMPHDTVITTANQLVHGGIAYNVEEVNIDQSWPVEKVAVLQEVS